MRTQTEQRIIQGTAIMTVMMLWAMSIVLMMTIPVRGEEGHVSAYACVMRDIPGGRYADCDDGKIHADPCPVIYPGLNSCNVQTLEITE